MKSENMYKDIVRDRLGHWWVEIGLYSCYTHFKRQVHEAREAALCTVGVFFINHSSLAGVK